MFMFDMIQNYPQQREALIKTMDHTKTSHNANTIPQKIVSQQVNVVEALPIMFKDNVEVSPFLLSIRIYGKNLYNIREESLQLPYCIIHSTKVRGQTSTYQPGSDIVGQNRGESHRCIERCMDIVKNRPSNSRCH